MDRRLFLLGSAARDAQIIEIGAGYAPIARKADGWRTHVIDHASQSELRTKYATAGIDLQAIETVDTIWDGTALDSVLPAELIGRVDLIIASHVLEHIPDLVGFLRSASKIVAPGGRLSVALPDRRYCFDCYMPWPTTGDLLEAHQRLLRYHSLRTRFNRWAYSAMMDKQLAWGPGPITVPAFMDPFDAAANTAAASNIVPTVYEDCHAWHFTPAGFRLAMLELRQVGFTDWIVEDLVAPGGFEFLAILRRSDGALPEPGVLQTLRRDLLLEQMREVQVQASFLLQGDHAPQSDPAANDGNAPIAPEMSATGQATPVGNLGPLARVLRAIRSKGHAN